MGSAKRNLSHSQNFLNSDSLVKRLITECGIKSDDIVYEIGPGKGIITKNLSSKCKKVVAIEYDDKLYENLSNDFGDYDNIEFVFADFLEVPLPSKVAYKIFSNIPFNITSEIMSKITQNENPPENAYLIMQEEASNRYTGYPYCGESLRSLLIKPYFELEITHRFKNTDFSPVPDVNIVLLSISKREKSLINKDESDKYSDLISYAFSQHGKNLRERLRNIFTQEQFKRLSSKLNFDISVSPVQLSFEQWLGIFNYYINGVSKEKQSLVSGASKRLIMNQKKIDKIHRSRK